MRTSIRLALPALATATALALTACGSDDDSGTDEAGNSQEAGGSSAGEQSEAPAEETSEEEAPTGTVPTVDELRGDWYVDPEDTSGSHNLTFFGPEAIIFIESMGVEGGLCDSGTYADGTLDLTNCTTGLGDAADDRSAELRLNEDGTLNAVWSSGESETYTNTVPGGEGFTEEAYEMYQEQVEELTASMLGN